MSDEVAAHLARPSDVAFLASDSLELDLTSIVKLFLEAE